MVPVHTRFGGTRMYDGEQPAGVASRGKWSALVRARDVQGSTGGLVSAWPDPLCAVVRLDAGKVCWVTCSTEQLLTRKRS